MDLRFTLIPLLCLCGLPYYPATAGDTMADNAESPRLLNQLASGLIDAPEPLRADFARIAINELVTVYAREAQHARHDIQQGSSDRDLWRWVTAVEGLASELEAIAGTVTPATPVEVVIDQTGSVYLIIDERPLLLGGPVPGEQASLEYRMVERFCNLNLCSELYLDINIERQQTTPGHLEPQWSFSQQAGPSCGTRDGLEFQFQDTSNLKKKRDACARIINELDTLASRIASEVASGTRIDWNSVTIRPHPEKEQHKVILNNAGSVLWLSLPTLASNQNLLRMVRPWLVARVGGSRYNLVVVNAERVMGPLIEEDPWDM